MLDKFHGVRNKNYTSERNPTNLSKPSLDVLKKTTDDTKTALEKLIQGKIKSKSIHTPNNNITDSKYIRYTPSTHSQRIVQLTELPKDPLEPVKFKHKRIPRDATEDHVPVMHSPPRKLTMKDQADLKVPPCISNWKNARGYTIPLEMRLSADGRNLRDFTVSDKFSKFADVLYMTEKQARIEIEERNKVQESIKMVDTLKKEQEFKEAARDARQKKLAMAVSNISSVNTTKTEETEIMLGNKRHVNMNEDLEAMKMERNNLRNIRKKEIENQRRIEVAGKKNKINPRDEDRDISEKIALGQAQPSGRDGMIDARLYNQTTGIEAGFKDEEDYDLYDKPLFADRTAASIYKNVKANTSIDEDDGKGPTIDSKKLMEKIHQRSKMFEGADASAISSSSGRGRPVEFEKNNEEYGLNDIHSGKNNK